MKRTIIALVLAVPVLAVLAPATVAQSAAICFLPDGSGSINNAEFALQLEGIALAIEDPSRIPHNGSVAVTVVQFATGTRLEVPLTTIDSQTTANNVAAAVRGINQLGGSTAMHLGLDAAVAALAGASMGANQIICLSTDGAPNSQPLALAAADNAIAAGIERIDCIGIAPANLAFLAQLQRNGQVFPVASFAEFRDSIGDKIAQVIRELCENRARRPGSVLIFPVHRSGPTAFTVLNVANTKTSLRFPQQTPREVSTRAHFEYVNAVPSANPLCPAGCQVFDRIEALTPGDARSVLTRCDNATFDTQEGYVVVSAQDPDQSDVAWSFNHLIGSALIINASNAIYQVNAIPICSPLVEGSPTDQNGNTFLDFDGIEYAELPEYQCVDAFVAVAGSQLALLNLTGQFQDTNTAYLTVYNDNEFALGARISFCCWFDQPLATVSPLFAESFLQSLPNDPGELDINCAGTTLETGWVMIDSIGVTNPGGQSVSNDGAILGMITAGPTTVLNGGKLLWDGPTGMRQSNGVFSRQ